MHMYVQSYTQWCRGQKFTLVDVLLSLSLLGASLNVKLASLSSQNTLSGPSACWD